MKARASRVFPGKCAQRFLCGSEDQSLWGRWRHHPGDTCASQFVQMAPPGGVHRTAQFPSKIIHVRAHRAGTLLACFPRACVCKAEQDPAVSRRFWQSVRGAAMGGQGPGTSSPGVEVPAQAAWGRPGTQVPCQRAPRPAGGVASRQTAGGAPSSHGPGAPLLSHGLPSCRTPTAAHALLCTSPAPCDAQQTLHGTLCCASADLIWPIGIFMGLVLSMSPGPGTVPGT